MVRRVPRSFHACTVLIYIVQVAELDEDGLEEPAAPAEAEEEDKDYTYKEVRGLCGGI